MMKTFYAFLVALLISSSTHALEAVPYVDIYRYLGTWYEIAKYPNEFQKNCVASKVNYSLWAEGAEDVIRVDNQCLESDGKIVQSIGKAYIEDSVSNAELRIQFFFKIINISWLQGRVWVVALDENYQYVAISDPTQNLLWILARTPSLEERTYTQILTQLNAQGFDLNRIVKNNPPADLKPEFFAVH